MNDLLQDLRFGLKLLRKDRGFLAAALLTLALCIGANTAIFSVVYSVLLRPLPYPAADRLVTLYNSYPNAGAPRASTAVPDYFDRRAAVEAFDESALYQSRGVTIGEAGSPERVLAMRVTPTFFTVLRVAPALGRAFLPEEGEPGNERRALLGHALWIGMYGGSSAVIGREIRIDGEPHTIVGVMPEGFLFGNTDTRLWVPIAFTEQQRSDDSRHSNNFQMIARLRAGATVEQAQAQVDAVNRQNLERFPQFRELLESAGFHTVVADHRAELTREIRSTLLLIEGGVLLVLLIGCVNIANLVLVRSTARSRELATRFALGAGRWRMARQLVTESVVLAAGGGLIGLVLGWAGTRAIIALAAEELPRAGEIGLHPVALASMAGLSMLAGLLFGTIPVVRLFRADLSTIFRQDSRTGTAALGALGARSTLVVTQISLAFALLIAAALLLVSFDRKLGVEPGFDETGVVTASLSMPGTRYPDEAARTSFVARALAAVRAIPGVEQAGVTSVIPFGDDYDSSVITPEGYVPKAGESPLSPIQSRITPGYLEALGVPVLRGRTFDARDVEGAAPVVIVDEWLARRYWPDQDPVGKRLYQGVPGMGEEPEYRTIVGVTREIRMVELAGAEQVGHYYFPYDQATDGTVYLAIRTTRDPLAVMAAVRAEITRLDPNLPLYAVQTMQDRIAGSLLTDRARMLLLVVFACVALLLAAIGIYGVLAYTVALRTKEIGIRVALGSQRPQIFQLVLRHGLKLLVIGLAVGTGASLLLSRVLRGMLYGIEPNDPRVFAAVLAVLAGVTVSACALPARRATRVDPVTALARDG